jgi:hypothetical protein
MIARPTVHVDRVEVGAGLKRKTEAEAGASRESEEGLTQVGPLALKAELGVSGREEIGGEALVLGMEDGVGTNAGVSPPPATCGRIVR